MIQVASLGQKDSLEEEMATCFSILPGKIPCTEELGNPWCHKELETTEHTYTRLLDFTD